MSREKLTAAVVGMGKMGLLHASILNVMPHVELIAVCEKSLLIQKLYKKIFACTSVQVINETSKLSNLDLDLIYVTTPISSHFEVVKDLASNTAVNNLFVEKTLASSYEEAKELCALAERFEGSTMVGYMKRFAVTFKKAKDLLDKEELGDLVSFEAYAFSSDFVEIQKNSKAFTSRGGALRDLGSHVIDLILWFFGDLKVKSASQLSLDKGFETSAQFEVTNSTNLQGKIAVSQCLKNYRLPEVGVTVNGSKGTLKVNDDTISIALNNRESSLLYRHDLTDNVTFCLGAPEYYREDEHFIQSIFTNSRANPDFNIASKVDYIIDEVRRIGDNK